MARSVKVSKKLWEGRQPLGAMRNSLPTLYLSYREEDDVWMLMRDGSTGESTGPQTCLAIISPETMAKIIAQARVPLELVAKE